MDRTGSVDEHAGGDIQLPVPTAIHSSAALQGPVSSLPADRISEVRGPLKTMQLRCTDEQRGAAPAWEGVSEGT